MASNEGFAAAAAMNCRSGDLCRVFRVTPGWEWAMDMFVIVTTPFWLRGEMCWLLSEPMPHPDGRAVYRFALDNCLRPIRDPGDDAQDESLAWLPPVPIREGQQA